MTGCSVAACAALRLLPLARAALIAGWATIRLLLALRCGVLESCLKVFGAVVDWAAVATPVASQKAAKPSASTSVNSAVAVTPAARKETVTKPTAAAATISAANEEAAA